MKNLQIVTLVDRLLYGPDNSDPEIRPFTKAGVRSPTGTTTTSPTLANSSPTESNIKSKAVMPSSTATSPVEHHAETPVSPATQEAPGDQSVTSSPTIFSSSPTFSRAKQSIEVQQTEMNDSPARAPTSSPTDHASVEGLVRTPNNEIPGTSPEPAARPIQPAIRVWKSVWARPEDTWHPTPMQIRPLVGVAGIVLAIACAFASLVVLIVSDGQPTADWPISPAVVLAIITAVANSAIALAYMEAVPVAFWYSMTRGRTVRSLERQWQVSRSIIYVGKMSGQGGALS